MTAKELLDIAKREIGTKENPAGSNRVKYNKWYYGKDVSGPAYPWCAVFVSWCFKGTGLVPKTASCLTMLQWFETRGQIVTDPEPGDIVFFKYNTNSRRTNHVGIVSADGNAIRSIEGNTSVTSNDNGGCVMERIRTKNIVAFARPKYSNSKSEKKSNEEIAIEVIDGKWGNGSDRKKKLIQAGYNFIEIQKIVNEIVRTNSNG